MTTPSRLVLAPLAALALGFLLACTPAPNPSPGSDPTGDVVTDSSVQPSGVDPTLDTSGVGAWCALLPAQLVAQTFGIAVHTPTASFTSEEILCQYLPVEDGDGTVEVRFRPNQDHADFVAYRQANEEQDEPSIDLPGVGDEAYYSVNQFEALESHVVVVRAGTVIVAIDAPGDLDQTTSLARAALTALS